MGKRVGEVREEEKGGFNLGKKGRQPSGHFCLLTVAGCGGARDLMKGGRKESEGGENK